jgi:PIN like domain
MNFFFYANVSLRISKMLAAYNEGVHEIVHITQHPDFKRNNVNDLGGNTTPDEEFLEKLSKSGLDWKIISGDNRIINTAHQRAALIASGLTFFCLDRNWSKAKAAEQAWKILKIWDEIVKRGREPGQAIYQICMGKKLTIELIRSARRR